jgi:hypothetical protein
MPAKGNLAGPVSGLAQTKPEPPVKRKRKSSAVSSGRRMFVRGDSSSAWSRRYRDIVAGHVSDLGGQPLLSEAEISLIKRISTLELECEQAEGRLSMGQEIDLDLYQRMTNSLRRALEAIGLQRRPRNALTLDGTVEEAFSPMRSRWAAEAAAEAAAAVKEGSSE